VIASLADAWRWYEGARLLAQTMERLGKKHWNNLPWEGDLGRDNHLKDLTSENILDGSNRFLDDLDDLCVLLLFSVFEAAIRDRVLAEVEAELPPLHHVAIKRALEEMKEGIEQGSFFKLLEPYKEQPPAYRRAHAIIIMQSPLTLSASLLPLCEAGETSRGCCGRKSAEPLPSSGTCLLLIESAFFLPVPMARESS
jgi:hypothetical protein